MRINPTLPLLTALALLLLSPAFAQVDPARAEKFFQEATDLCAREGGRIWGIPLCGPMVFADPATGTIATSEPAPDAPRPRALGYANTALQWGDIRWSTFVWSLFPLADERQASRGRLMIHELFHRVQPELKLLITSSPGENDHLDTAQGRYWMQLEWRALERALEVSGDPEVDAGRRRSATADALAFRRQRRALFPASPETERISEINEGLPQYTATVVVAESQAAAMADAVQQLKEAPAKESFVRTFPYASGAAYGILLDLASPGWPRRIRASDDLGQMLAEALGLEAGLENLVLSPEVEALAAGYGAAELLKSERRRAEERAALVADYRRRFLDMPVLVMPRGRGASFVTNGITPIPGAGTIYPQFRVSGPWGNLEADEVLISSDGESYRLPATDVVIEGSRIVGRTWKLSLAPGWNTRPGSRPGDYEVVQEEP